jgi:hypothetical protein
MSRLRALAYTLKWVGIDLFSIFLFLLLMSAIVKLIAWLGLP